MRRAGRPDLLLAAGWALGASLLTGAPVEAEERAAVGGLVDLEGWRTDSRSEFPGRDDGRASGDLRVRLWVAADLGIGFQAFVRGAAEGGAGAVEETGGPALEQAFLRYSRSGSKRLVVEAGRIGMPIGNFSRRYLSSVNPLVGDPVGYPAQDPLGARVSGWSGLIDYTVAIIDRPWTYGADVPEPGHAFRPAVALGVTPTVGLRLGAYATQGPYLPDHPEARQSVVGMDLQFGRGYFVLNGDFAWTRYQVPGSADTVEGRMFWIEPVYTWSPRFYTALRAGWSDEPYVEAEGTGWSAERPRLLDLEAGLGVRLMPRMVLKVSYRSDRWKVDSTLRPDFPDGHAVAAQLSYMFDVLSWFERKR